MKVFLGGPIQHLRSDISVLEKMEELIRSLSVSLSLRGASVFNAHLIEEFGLISHTIESSEIAERDYVWMSECDVFVAFFPLLIDGTPVRSDGTHVEFGWATALQKPVILVVDEPGARYFSDLVKGLIANGAIKTFSLTESLLDPEALTDQVLSVYSAII